MALKFTFAGAHRWLEDMLGKKPVVAVALALLVPLLLQRASESALVANVILIIVWASLTLETLLLGRPGEARTSIQRSILTLVASLLVGAVLYVSLWRYDSRFVILYSNSRPLNHQSITLNKGLDPTRPTTTMIVELNIPSSFSTWGISAKNEGTVPLEPDIIYLSFSSVGISKWRRNAGCWEPSPDHNSEGWATFRCVLGKTAVSAGHSLAFEVFTGTPVPTVPVKARAEVIYGEKEAVAGFMLMPPP